MPLLFDTYSNHPSLVQLMQKATHGLQRPPIQSYVMFECQNPGITSKIQRLFHSADLLASNKLSEEIY